MLQAPLAAFTPQSRGSSAVASAAQSRAWEVLRASGLLLLAQDCLVQRLLGLPQGSAHTLRLPWPPSPLSARSCLADILLTPTTLQQSMPRAATLLSARAPPRRCRPPL